MQQDREDREPVRPRRGAIALAAAGVVAVGLMGATAIGAIPGGGDAATQTPAQVRVQATDPSAIPVQEGTETRPADPAPAPGMRGPGDCPPGAERDASGTGGTGGTGTTPGAESSAPADTPAVTLF